MLLFVKGYKLRFLVSDDRDLYALIKGGRFQGLDSWLVRTGRTENMDAGGTFCSCPFFHDFLNLIVSIVSILVQASPETIAYNHDIEH